MRKDVSGLVATLQQSAREIAGSGAENRDELLEKSFAEFEAALLGQLDPILLPERDEPLAKGLTHIGRFHDTLFEVDRCLQLMKTDRDVSPEILDQIERFGAHGTLVLRAMVNDSAELPEDDADLERAEQTGELAKVEAYDGTDFLVKSALPEDLRAYLTDPVEMLAQYALLGRAFTDDAIGMADPLAKAEMLPGEIVAEFPELFEPDDDATGLGKLEDETSGAGGNADAAPDPGDAVGDDVMQNPVDMALRMASILVVLLGAIQKGQGGDPTQQEAAGEADDGSGAPQIEDQAAAPPPAAPPQRHAPVPGATAPAAHPPGGAPPAADPRKKPNPFAKMLAIEDVPLEKILAGEIAVSDSVADALEERDTLRGERETLRKSLDALTGEQEQTRAAMLKMQETIDRLSRQPAAPKGALFAMGKGDDTTVYQPGSASRAGEDQRIADLAKNNPDAAARELLKIVHSGGGRPIIASDH